ncbi:MAG TPA: DUF5318 family protein [Corynebacterium sp.]|nr:DUF5318 family protein [Corynebacterium sp.]
MIIYRNEVSHRWQRQMLLRAFHEGKIPRDNLCDADFLLLAAARHHGHPVERPCPVCGRDSLHEVRWIYDERLGRRSGTARTEKEIAEIAKAVPYITVHLVEVCLHCQWNHLLTASLAEAA